MDNGFKSIDLSLFVVDADGRNVRKLWSMPFFTGGVDWPTWSPDGRQIAMTYFDTSKNSQIYTYKLDTGSVRELTEHPDGAYDPAWSPDGRWIAYTVRSRGRNDVVAMPATGGAPTALTTGGACLAPAWSPDGSALVYIAQGEDNTADIVALKLSFGAGISVEGSQALTRGEQVKTTSGLSWAL
jgi:TolB protein